MSDKDGHPTERRRRPNMQEVALLANVAISSVSRVISGRPGVSPILRSRVLAAVRQLEYEPDFLAQSLRRGATLSVGWVIGDFSNPLMASITSGAESALRAAGYSMLLMNSENDPDLDAAHIHFFQKRRVDGMILSLANEHWQPTLDAMAQSLVPIVVVDREVPPQLGVSVVRNDHRLGMNAAVEHLADLGHSRIALITGALDLWPVRERIAGMREAVVRRGISDQAIVVAGSLTAEHGEATTEDLVRMSERPTAMIAGGIQVLPGSLRALARRGLIIPDDVSLVTCDDTAISELHSPPIASIGRDNVTLGRVAAELLLKRIIRSSEPETVLLPTTFTARASCAPPPLT